TRCRHHPPCHGAGLSALEGDECHHAGLGASTARTVAGRHGTDDPRLASLSCHRRSDKTTTFFGAARRSLWHHRTARDRADHAHRSAGTRGHHRRTLVRTRVVSAQGRTPVTTVFG